MPDDASQREGQANLQNQHWQRGHTEYIRNNDPSQCDDCDVAIPPDEAGFFVDGPASPGDGSIGELCISCGQAVLGIE